MSAFIIGLSLGLLTIASIAIFKQLNKSIMYGLILAGIGFLYVGFTWTNLPSFIVCCLQAVVFVLIAYFGSQKRIFLLGGGYLLHGIWDLLFGQVSSSRLLPPHYDVFCLTVDFTIGIYLIYLSYKKESLGSFVTD
jgi:hypothetical protein